MTPLDRLRAFVDDAQAGMERRLLPRLPDRQSRSEMAALPESFRKRLNAVFDDWGDVYCLKTAAQQLGQIPAAVDYAQQASFSGSAGKVRSCAQNSNGYQATRYLCVDFFTRAAIGLIFFNF